jgi:hypothetical protein
MPANENDACVLYWLKSETCTDPRLHGYIGITKNERSRASDHKRRFPSHTFTVLARGTRKECAAIEAEYRPGEGTGLNKSRGGGRWRGQRKAP